MLNKLASRLLFPCLPVDKSALRRRLKNKTVLITGASYGIGEALAYALADLPVRLILVARTQEKLQQIQSDFTARKADCQTFAADLSKPDECQTLAEAIDALPYPVDIFVNNAGKSIRRPLMASLDRLHDAERTMSLNYFAPVRLCLHLLKGHRPRFTHIVNVSAANVLLAPTPHWAAYQASKTAFDQWLRCGEPELRAGDVRVSSVYFPLVGTRMIEPTYANRSVPVLPVEKAANILCRALLTQKSAFKPWWLPLGQLCSVLFNSPWRRGWIRYLKASTK
ncbi:epimerase [Leminorella grimontii]|uniref:Epimerase n=1 Tax=Leminorella grimontii TaxID=82981 RepID=A0AAV5N414_9GAMM|nr:SDR family NAD(P)-dependent oxidoreductase [Leminorella grimontii]KFC94881.1 short-chain dehydrogenase/reductase family oxidoreductase [Leminorella grimontii ATCC 33999 = DSM 5078]GKX56846.1 epimerase [Leminorella grimontii]VFS61028.1 Fatty acyl-CoA reductase [Leminorella grimontii]